MGVCGGRAEPDNSRSYAYPKTRAATSPWKLTHAERHVGTYLPTFAKEYNGAYIGRYRFFLYVPRTIGTYRELGRDQSRQSESHRVLATS